MEISVRFAQGMQVNAFFENFTVKTDQAKTNGGDETAPDPYAYFLSSLATCAGFFVLRFCQSRQLPTDGIELTLDNDWNPQKGCPDNINIHIKLPPEFPEKYQPALIRATHECGVKKTLLNPPAINISTQQG